MDGWLATAVQGLTCHTVTRDLGNVLHSHETSTALLHATVRIDGTQQPDMSTQYVDLLSCTGPLLQVLTALLGGVPLQVTHRGPAAGCSHQRTGASKSGTVTASTPAVNHGLTTGRGDSVSFVCSGNGEAAGHVCR